MELQAIKNQIALNCREGSLESYKVSYFVNDCLNCREGSLENEGL